MPQAVLPAFRKLVVDVFLSATRPANLYMGLSVGAPADMLSLVEVSAFDSSSRSTGYARQTVALSSITNPGAAASALILPTVIFPAFTQVPTTATNQATHWFVCDALTGTAGKLYAYGPLNPAIVAGVLAAAGARGQSVISMANGTASSLSPQDFLYIGTVCGADQELLQVVSIGTAVGANTPVTISYSLGYVHAIGTAFNRDGATRVYGIGFVETVNATISLGQG